jgi:hypothetical protein
MGLNLERLLQTEWHRPLEAVPCPELAPMGLFEPGEEPVVWVRGLTSNELYLALEARQQNTVRVAVMKALESNRQSELNGAMGRALNINEHEEPTAAETAYRMEACLRGVVDKDGHRLLTLDHVVKLADHSPTTFMTISGKILSLSGEGSKVGEP